MINILIVSATSGNNLILAKEIKNVSENKKVKVTIVNLEEYVIPLYTTAKNNKIIPSEIGLLTKKFINTDAFIFCAPEYNGSIPPILTNLIAWISVSTSHWRDVFNGKIGLLATHSGGLGTNILRSMRIQLEHLGVLVLPRTIVVNKNSNFNAESCKNKIEQLISLIKK